MKSPRSLRSFFRLYISFASLTSLLVTAGIVLFRVEEGVRTEVYERNMSVAHMLAGRVSGFLREPAAVLDSMGGLFSVHLNPSHLHSSALDLDDGGHLSAALAGRSLFDSIALLDRQGMVSAVGLPPSRRGAEKEYLGLELGHLDFIRAARTKNAPVWSDAFLSLLGGQKGLALCLPLKDGRALLGNFRIDLLEAYLGDLNLKGASAALLDQNGDILLASEKGFGERLVNLGSIEPVRKVLDAGGGATEFSVGGDDFLGCAWIIPENGWVALVIQPVSTARELLYDAMLSFALAFAAALALALVITSRTAAFLSRPLLDLSSRVRDAEAYPAAFGDKRYGIREIDDVGQRFARLLATLGHREEMLRDSERKYRQLVESVPVIPWEMDFDADRFLYVGPQAETLLGYAPSLWTNFAFWASKVHPEDRETVVAYCLEQTKAGLNHELEYRFLRPDGSVVWLHEVVAVVPDPQGGVRLLGLMIDITNIKRMEQENRELEKRLRQSQKLEAIGTLAGGVAHDFNNILGVIMGYTELTLMTLEDDSPQRENLEQVLTAVRRARDIVRQILTFSRMGEQEAVPLELSPIVKEGAKLLRATIPTTIAFHVNVPERSGHVCIDPTAVHQLLINLCTNAALAMKEKGGTLTMTLDRFTVGGGGLPKARETEEDVPPGEYVRLTVSDTGVGMDPKTLERIFEPYFTTRPVGEGSGLGLSVVHGIVRSAGGHIRVASAPGRGTDVQVFLPVTALLPEAVLVEEEKEMAGGRERLLVVDDETGLLDLMRKLLSRLGYRVTIVPSAVRALELFRASPEAFDLILSDQNMPGMSGIDFCKAVRALSPRIPFLLFTGYSDQLDQERAAKIGATGLVQKPFNRFQLAKAVRGALDGKAA